MLQYVTSVLRVLKHLSPAGSAAASLTTAELDAVAQSTVQDAFAPPSAALHTDALTLQQFTHWYCSSPLVATSVSTSAKSSSRSSKGTSPAAAAAVAVAPRQQQQQQQQPEVAVAGLARARRLLRLHCFTVDDLLEVMAEAATAASQGLISKQKFARAFGYMLSLGGVAEGHPQRSQGQYKCTVLSVLFSVLMLCYMRLVHCLVLCCMEYCILHVLVLQRSSLVFCCGSLYACLRTRCTSQ
jgi:hypothetical protein